MGNQGVHMCCNNAYVNKGHEVLHINETQVARMRNQKQTDGENLKFAGEMNITDRKDNELLVKHIRNTSLMNNSKCDFDRIQLLNQIAMKAPKLQLKVLSSGVLKGQILKINAQGLEGSLRNTYDGITFFGCKKHGNQQGNTEVLNDFVIPSKDKETEKRHRGRHMQIEYFIDEQAYKIKDLGIGFGAFVRLEHQLELKDNHLVNLGESFIIVNLINDKMSMGNYSISTHDSKEGTECHMKLRLKLFGGPSTGEVFYFKPDTEQIKIGRSNSCQVSIEDPVLSKFQASIFFDQEREIWILEDGMNQKKSLNGTWLYINDDFTIYDGMTFKVNQTLFQATITQ